MLSLYIIHPTISKSPPPPPQQKKQEKEKHLQKRIIPLLSIHNRHDGKISTGIISPTYLPGAGHWLAVDDAAATGESGVGVGLGRGGGGGCGGGVVVEAGDWGCVRGDGVRKE